MPSHLFEYFARDSRVLRSWARHFQTGESLPLDLLEEALNDKNEFGALEVQKQILYSVADQYIFGPSMDNLQQKSNEEIYINSLLGISELQNRLTALPVYKEDATGITYPSMDLLHHGHFVAYGGGYYSYLFAKMYAAQIWHTHFEKNPLSREAGETLLNKLLIYGNGKKADKILYDIVDGELDPSFYLQSI